MIIGASTDGAGNWWYNSFGSYTYNNQLPNSGGEWHGGCGGGTNPGTSTTNASFPGCAIWGGGGGPGSNIALQSGFGTSLHGGSGNYRAAGSTPAGGGAGGYGNGVNAYNGGGGRIIVTSW